MTKSEKATLLGWAGFALTCIQSIENFTEVLLFKFCVVPYHVS